MAGVRSSGFSLVIFELHPIPDVDVCWVEDPFQSAHPSDPDMTRELSRLSLVQFLLLLPISSDPTSAPSRTWCFLHCLVLVWTTFISRMLSLQALLPTFPSGFWMQVHSSKQESVSAPLLAMTATLSGLCTLSVEAVRTKFSAQ